MATESTNTWYFGAHFFHFPVMLSMLIFSTFEINLILKIKYYDSIDWYHFVMSTILIVVFDSIENHNSYLWLIFTFFSDSLKLIYSFCKVTVKNMTAMKIKILVFREKLHLWVLAWSKLTTFTLNWCSFFSNWFKAVTEKIRLLMNEWNKLMAIFWSRKWK